MLVPPLAFYIATTNFAVLNGGCMLLFVTGGFAVLFEGALIYKLARSTAYKGWKLWYISDHFQKINAAFLI